MNTDRPGARRKAYINKRAIRAHPLMTRYFTFFNRFDPAQSTRVAWRTWFPRLRGACRIYRAANLEGQANATGIEGFTAYRNIQSASCAAPTTASNSRGGQEIANEPNKCFVFSKNPENRRLSTILYRN